MSKARRIFLEAPTRKKVAKGISAELPSPIRLWLLRILVAIGGYREFVGDNFFCNDALARAVGLEHWIEEDAYRYEKQEVIRELKLLYKASEEAGADDADLGLLHKNSRKLAELVGLSASERRILEFAVVVHTEDLLETAVDYLGPFNSASVIRLLSSVLDIAEAEVRQAFSTGGPFGRGQGLVSIDQSFGGGFRSCLDLLSLGFGNRMLSLDQDPIELFKDSVYPAPESLLGLQDFAYISRTLDLLVPYLKQVVSEHRAGVNILLHGQPGTGKTQMARAIADAVDVALFEVSSQDDDGDPIDSYRRLRALRAALGLLDRQKAVMVFDEAEDVFNDGRVFLQPSRTQQSKGWLNRLLENNSKPIIWITNCVDCIDPAVIRRMDVVQELSIPNKSHRARIIEKTASDILRPEAISRFAESKSLSAGVIERASRVVRTVSKTLPPDAQEKILEDLVKGTLAAQGHSHSLPPAGAELPAFYDPEFVNSDVALGPLVEGLRRSAEARICLFGVPGSGKSAWGRWVADQLDVPLHVHRASDIVSPLVGMSETNIATAFRDAQNEGAVLLIDEVDSFLLDRRGGHHSWEISMVNEMLTQMEAYTGIFIATTNREDALDQASLRRYDLKVRLNYLKPTQAWALFEAHCNALAIDDPSPRLQSGLNQLTNLTPGDFRAVLRRARFQTITDPAEFLEALAKECAFKEDGKKRAIGFI